MYRKWELEVILKNPDYLWRVFNHNNTLLGVFPTRKAADKEAQYYRRMTGNPAYVMHEEMV